MCSIWWKRITILTPVFMSSVVRLHKMALYEVVLQVAYSASDAYEVQC